MIQAIEKGREISSTIEEIDAKRELEENDESEDHISGGNHTSSEVIQVLHTDNVIELVVCFHHWMSSNESLKDQSVYRFLIFAKEQVNYTIQIIYIALVMVHMQWLWSAFNCNSDSTLQ